METLKLLEYCKDVAKLASKNKGHYGNLVFPQRISNRPVIREPEIRDIFGRYLMLELIYYGIEVPTKNKYSFSGKKEICARTDLSIFNSLEDAENNLPSINIEFKEGQPRIAQIEKDWIKLLLEDVSIGCFYHILQNSDKRTIVRLKEKYEKAYQNALSSTSDKVIDKEFLLFILVVEKQICYSTISTIKKFTVHSIEENLYHIEN